FQDPAEAERYRFDLIKVLQRNLIWTDYSLSYDQLLTNVVLYDDLVRKMMGETGKLPSIPPAARVLDVGAGTGNIASRLNNGQRLVICIENNRTMFTLLQAKCRSALRRDDAGPGVITLKQDIASMRGLPRGYFDVIIANNVFYSLPDPDEAMK